MAFNLGNYLQDNVFSKTEFKQFTGGISNIAGRLVNFGSILKLNPQFLNLTNRLILKYNLFSNTPIEYQFLMCISTSIYLTIQMNKSKPSMEQFLNQKI